MKVIIKTSLIFSKSCFEFFSFTYVPFEKSSTLKKNVGGNSVQIRDTRGRKALVQMDLFFFTFLELKCSMDLDEKEDLKLRLLKFQDLAASIDKLAMADIPLNEIEQSLAKEQMGSMDLDEKEER